MDITSLYHIYQAHPIVTTDSRHCPQNSIFIALKGASFDGNRFAASALSQGCAYAVIDDPQYAVPGDSRYILVDDCLTTYKELAREHRRQFNIPVLGITGTNGKTTTKELISAVLATKYRVMHTEANFNNDVGVPRTLLRLTADDQIAVVEMGASHPGDIKRLVEYVEPTCGLITNVGRAHLQGFGSFEGVKRTKGELYDYLKASPATQVVWINADSPDLLAMASERGLDKLHRYGTESDDVAVKGEVTGCTPYLSFRWNLRRDDGTRSEWHEVHTHLIGSYNVSNMLAAVSVGLDLGVSEEQVCQALEAYIPTNSRSELRETAHNRLIVDAYNANPSSMMAALRNFVQMDGDHKMVILGDMRELGEVSLQEHQQVVDYLSQQPSIETVWLVGGEFAKARHSFRAFGDVEEVKQAILADPPLGRLILIKGSNSTKLWQLPDIL